MPQFPYVPHPEGTTPSEFQALLKLRREALEAVARKVTELFPRQANERAGWKAHLRIQGRDRDGSLCAHIVVEGPRGEIPYTRSVRLVEQKPLPRSLG